MQVNEPCHELLITCQWAGETFSCSDLFNSALTDEGLCCVFNRVPRDLLFRNPSDLPDLNITFPFPAFDWNPEKVYPAKTKSNTLPWRPAGAGKHLGLTIMLDLEVHEYFCSSTASAGLKVWFIKNKHSRYPVKRVNWDYTLENLRNPSTFIKTVRIHLTNLSTQAHFC